MKVYEANNKALEVWSEATGLDPKNPNVLGGLYQYHEAIRESQDVDPSALTTPAEDHRFPWHTLLPAAAVALP